MNKKLSFKGIYKFICILFGIINIAYLGYIFCFDSDKYIKLFSILFVLICWGIGFTFLYFLRKKIVIAYKSFDEYIDNIVLKKENVVFEFEQDDLLSKSQHKLKRLYDCMAETNQRNEKEKLEIQKFISDISHQIKTPMANLKLYNSTILERELDKETILSFIELMNGQLNKMDFLIQSLIKISRLENGIIHINMQKEFIHETIAKAIGNIFMSTQEKNIEVEVNCNTELLVNHDSKWTSEAIFNILDNAVKYTDNNGKIKINVIELEIFIRIDISDNGMGISKENLCKIFERFYREEDVNSMPGVGIGLYLARKIVTMEGGYIKVDSKKGEGSVFSIFLLK